MIIVPVVVIVVGIAVGLLYVDIPSAASNKMLSHKHVQLNITFNGQGLQVPSGIGIKQKGFEDLLLYGDNSLDKYGMEGMSPLHTHDGSGLLHVESNTIRDFTLGEFLSVWRGLDVDGQNVKATVDGKTVSEFRNLILNDGSKIKLDIT